MDRRKVLIISGTNRPESNALRVARVLEGHYQREGAAADLLSLCDLPPEIFRPEAYAHKPPGFAGIQERVLGAAGLHVVTPEYNGSFPGVLKYFIDMLKFPESFEHRPVAFVGQANGIFGALRPVEQLQMIFGYRNAFVYPDRVFVAAAREKFDATGKIVDSVLDERLGKQVRGFLGFIACLGGR